ncbi:hypothetical protein J31TS4_44050 [Paenibacillus sp. J31TS4]|uniref:hypothetical protein n=1 Tax=Paenibacillus sp. J31TS4 TaxID=2807195 RepID=UPI001B00D484|nr:hypothetical protein [Paenibacillus sp. J31TS4]GIP41125.1 hypothetical protein J31TS4_44050 [Paenibacillus sp. J31TS4]
MNFELFHLEHEMMTRKEEVESAAKHGWMYGGVPGRSKWALFRREEDHERLSMRAKEVLREMLEHENLEIRLRAAEIVLRHTARSKG